VIPLLVAAGAALGAPLRYMADRAVQTRHDTVFPWGTFSVNLAGSFILGLVGALAARLPGSGSELSAFAGTGFCGALTTYSTFSYETLRLLQDRAHLHAVANLLGSVLTGLGAALVGATLGLAVLGIP
jgi:CrcB protein